MTHVRDDIIPEDLSTLVLDAASALPAGDYGLDRVVRRRRAHQRRTVAALSVLSLVVMAAAAAIPLAFRATATGPAGTPGESAQRLYYYGAADPGAKEGTLTGIGSTTDPRIVVRVPSGIVELDDTGKPVQRVDLGPNVNVLAVFGLPDGGLVALDGHRRLPPDNLPDRVHVLTVVAQDGTVRVSRSLGASAGTAVRLVGATADTAYLMRDDRLVRHDLASGKERSAPAAGRVDELIGQGWSVDSVVSGRVLLTRQDPRGGARALVLEPSGAGETTAALGCATNRVKGTPDLVLAPDGRHLACYAARAEEKGETLTQLTVTDLATGREALRRDFSADVILAWYESLAWTDDGTLRLALLRLPPGRDGGEFDLLELLQVQTFRL